MSSDECDISEFSDLFDLYEDHALLTYKDSPKEAGTAVGTPAHDATGDVSGPVDVGQRLSAMRHEGPGNSSIHFTQLHVTASLTASGNPVEDTVTRVLMATRAAVKNDPECAGWDWNKEEDDIRGMCFDLINKAMRTSGEDLSPCLPNGLYNDWTEVVAAGKRPHVVSFNGKHHVRAYSWNKEEGAPAAANGDGTGEATKDGNNVLRLVSNGDENKKRPRTALSVSEWMERDLPEPDFCLGYWLSTTSRAEIYAPTGLGKSMLAVGIAFAVSQGDSFLHWVGCGKPKRVLYVDGEMAQRLLKRRIIDEAKRSGNPQDLYLLNTGDIEDFSPLDDPRGRQAIDDEIERVGGVDLLILDNIMALLGGDMKDEESWRKTLPWQKSLTSRHIGLLWIHHTGHDTSKGYGTKTREWQLDTVIALEAVERPETDVSFQLTFKKNRERTPESRADFADVRVALINNEWTYETVEAGSARRPSPTGTQFLRALTNVLCGDDVVTFRGERAVKLEPWRRECVTLGLIYDDKPHSGRTLLAKHRRELISCNLVGCHEDLTWLLQKRR